MTMHIREIILNIMTKIALPLPSVKELILHNYELLKLPPSLGIQQTTEDSCVIIIWTTSSILVISILQRIKITFFAWERSSC